MTRPATLPAGIPTAYSVAQVARALSVSVVTIYREIERGALPALYIGDGPRQKRVIRHEDLETYLNSVRQERKAS